MSWALMDDVTVDKVVYKGKTYMYYISGPLKALYGGIEWFFEE